jgi:hypothetical protein
LRLIVDGLPWRGTIRVTEQAHRLAIRLDGRSASLTFRAHGLSSALSGGITCSYEPARQPL